MNDDPSTAGVAAPHERVSLKDLRALYLVHAERHYRRRSGAPTREHLNMRAVLDRFAAFAGEINPAEKVNRHQVRAWLDQLAAEKLTRPYVNACLSRLRRWLRWAADLDYVPIRVVEELRLVRPLQPFRSDATEPTPARPPELDAIDRAIAAAAPPARHVLQLLRLTGARPGELLELSNAEVHLDDQPRLTPLQHKCAHHGHHRVIPLCPAAAAVVQRYARPLCPLDPLFVSRRRRGPLSIEGLRTAWLRACRRAGVARCELYDIRRRTARHVRRELGLDAAQALLGHSHASTTEVYAPLDAGDAEAFEQARRATEVL